MKKHYLTFLYTFPADIIVFILVLAIWALWGTKLHWNRGLWCELKKDSWPTRTWYRFKYKGEYTLVPPHLKPVHGTWVTWTGTTFGHGGFYGTTYAGDKGTDTRTEFHEQVHIEQFEAATLHTFLLAVLIFALVYPALKAALISSLIVWATGSLQFVLVNTFHAWMCGKDFYRGSIHEEAARAITSKNFKPKTKRVTKKNNSL